MTRSKSVIGNRSARLMGALSLILAACEPAAPAAAPPPPPPPPPPPAAAPAPAPAATMAPAATPAPVIPAAIVVKDAALKTPESVVYDADLDVYLVSNINGKPTDADDNGTISKLDPEGKVIDAAFIDGAKKEIKLNAPKGMAIVGDALYVADLNVVRIFDKKTGKAKGEIKAAKATFLNGITPGPAGKLFLSDSGLKMGKDALESSGTDAVYTVDTKAVTAKALRTNKDLLSPNGVLGDEDGVYVVTFGGNELYRLTKKGDKEKVTTLPKGKLDGIVKIADGTLLVSSWEAGAIYRGRPGGTFEPILTGLKSPAAIGYDSKRNRVLIPGFETNEVIIQPLPQLAPIAEPMPPAPAPAAAAPAKPAAAPAAAPAPAAAAPAKPAAAPAAAPAPAPAAPAAAPAPAKPAPAAAPPKPAAPAATTAAPAPAPAPVAK